MNRQTAKQVSAEEDTGATGERSPVGGLVYPYEKFQLPLRPTVTGAPGVYTGMHSTQTDPSGVQSAYPGSSQQDTTRAQREVSNNAGQLHIQNMPSSPSSSPTSPPPITPSGLGHHDDGNRDVDPVAIQAIARTILNRSNTQEQVHTLSANKQPATPGSVGSATLVGNPNRHSENDTMERHLTGVIINALRTFRGGGGTSGAEGSEAGHGEAPPAYEERERGGDSAEV
jgi:hypothetical protein